jgi:hypothetical protein
VRVAPRLAIAGRWRRLLTSAASDEELAEFRAPERTGRVLGDEPFPERLEPALSHVLRRHKPGPKKASNRLLRMMSRDLSPWPKRKESLAIGGPVTVHLAATRRNTWRDVKLCRMALDRQFEMRFGTRTIETRWVTSMVAMFFLATLVLAKTDDEQTVSLRREYKQAVGRLSEPLRNLRCDVDIKRTTRLVGKNGALAVSERIATSLLYVIDECRLSEYWYWLKWRDASGFRTDSSPTRCQVTCVTPEFAFLLRQPRQSNTFVIDHYGNAARDMAGLRLSTVEGLDKYVFAAFWVGNASVEKLLTDSSFRVLNRSERLVDGETIVDVCFSLDKSPLGFNEGRIAFAPGLQWAVREYEISTPESGPDRHRVLYLGTVGYTPPAWGIPKGTVFPKRVHLTEVACSAGKEYRRDEYDLNFKSVTLNGAFPQDFTLSNFGLPNIPLTPARRTFFPFDHWLFWTFVAGATLGTVLLRRLRNKVSYGEIH